MNTFISKRSMVWWVCMASLSGCTTLVPPKAKMSKQTAQGLVADLPDTLSKSVALTLMSHPNVQYRVDHHGYPAWRWRGKDDIGGCVHIDPATLKPYLENQFSRSQRTDVPKYIDFGTDGRDWQCRIHKFTISGEIEKNWSTPVCNRDGRKLLSQLAAALGR